MFYKYNIFLLILLILKLARSNAAFDTILSWADWGIEQLEFLTFVEVRFGVVELVRSPHNLLDFIVSFNLTGIVNSLWHGHQINTYLLIIIMEVRYYIWFLSPFSLLDFLRPQMANILLAHLLMRRLWDLCVLSQACQHTWTIIQPAILRKTFISKILFCEALQECRAPGSMAVGPSTEEPPS